MSSFSPVAPDDDGISNRLLAEDGSPPQPVRAAGRPRVEIAIVAAGQIVQQVLTLGTGIVIAHMLGAAGYGLVNLLRSLFTAVLTISPLGLDLALLKLSGQFAHDRLYLDATVQRLRLIAFAFNLAIALIVGVAFGGILQRDVFPYEGFERLLLVTLVALPFASDLAILSAYYKGMERPGVFALMTIYLQSASRVVMVAIAALTGASTLTIVAINTAQVLISFVAVVLHLRSTRGRGPLGQAAPPSARALLDIFRVSLWMAVSLFIYGMMRFVDIMFLGHFATAKDVGEYGALSTIAQLVQVYPLAASQTLGPTIARHYANNDMSALKAALASYIHMASIVAAFLFAGIAVFGDQLDLVFGHSFHFSRTVAFLMPLGYLLSATLAPTGYSLSMTGRHRGETVILALGAASLVVLCYLLIPIWGQVGAALASASAFMIINVVRFIYVSRVLHFVPGYARDLLPPVVALAIAYGARWVVGGSGLDRNLLSLLIACVLFTIGYGLACTSLFLDAGERKALLAFARRRLRR